MAVRSVNQSFPRSLSVIVTTFWMLVGGMGVVYKKLKLGTFLVVLQSFSEVGEDMAQLYNASAPEAFPLFRGASVYDPLGF